MENALRCLDAYNAGCNAGDVGDQHTLNDNNDWYHTLHELAIDAGNLIDTFLAICAVQRGVKTHSTHGMLVRGHAPRTHL